MEGKEVRFGITSSALFATVTTDASCGGVNAMHDSFMPLGCMVPLVNMILGEVVFGGVGAGLYGMLIFVILSVFIAGLMVGRTPEYLGKKIESFDVKMAMLYVLIFPLSILGFSAIALIMPNLGLASLANGGRTDSRRFSTPIHQPPQTTARHLPASVQTRMVQPIAWCRDAHWAIPDDCSNARARRQFGT